MNISAMKCALQSLESVEKVNGWNKDSIVGRHCAQSAHFLRQAITEAEKQEPVAWFIQYEYRHEFLWREPTAYEKNSALEIKPLYTSPVHASDISQERVDETAKCKHEPVAWVVDGEIKVRLDMAGKLYYSETNVYGKDVVAEAIKQEREACAQILEADANARGKGGGGLVLLKAAERIRARGEE